MTLSATTNPGNLKTFDERMMYMLSWIYDNGGSEYKDNQFNSSLSYGIAGCQNKDEFNRLMDALMKNGWVTCANVTPTIGGTSVFFGVKLTVEGIKEAKKDLPQIPMIGLVNQVITTGDHEVDQKINHARKLFFSERSTMDDMRSACETLSYVLEPLRDNLKLAISTADVEAFFQLVNKFDIRHNKAHTINLVHPEQLEWVFYSLLNTINVYTKLKARLT